MWKFDGAVKMRPGHCACCKKCWINPVTGHCLYGGPFTGYEPVRERESGGTAAGASSTLSRRDARKKA